MRLTFDGTSAEPVSKLEIMDGLVSRSNELYGPLPGIEEAADKIAEQLLAIAANQRTRYQIVVRLDDDGGYGFYVYAARYLTTRPRCRSWDGPGYYMLEAGSLGGGSPFDRHLVKGWLMAWLDKP